MSKLWPVGQILPASPFILARQHLHKLILPPRIERKNFFSFREYGWQRFSKKISLNSAKKRGENFLFWKSHSYVDRDLHKKRSSPCFPISLRPAASTVFPNLALCVKSLPTPGIAYLFFPGLCSFCFTVGLVNVLVIIFSLILAWVLHLLLLAIYNQGLL